MRTGARRSARAAYRPREPAAGNDHVGRHTPILARGHCRCGMPLAGTGIHDHDDSCRTLGRRPALPAPFTIPALGWRRDRPRHRGIDDQAQGRDQRHARYRVECDSARRRGKERDRTGARKRLLPRSIRRQATVHPGDDPLDQPTRDAVYLLSVKLIVIVKSTETGAPFSSVGV